MPFDPAFQISSESWSFNIWLFCFLFNGLQPYRMNFKDKTENNDRGNKQKIEIDIYEINFFFEKKN